MRKVNLISRDIELYDVGEPLFIRVCSVKVAIDSIFLRMANFPTVRVVATTPGRGDA